MALFSNSLMLFLSLLGAALHIAFSRELITRSLASAAMEFWNTNHPQVEAPAELIKAVSPLRDSEVSSYLTQLNTGVLNSTQLCSAGKLYCDSSRTGISNSLITCRIYLTYSCNKRKASQQELTIDQPRIFFHEKELHTGHVDVSDLRDKEPFRAALPQALASTISKKAQSASDYRKLFGVRSDSLLGQDMEETLGVCSDGNCVTSLEDLAAKGNSHSKLYYQHESAGPLKNARIMGLSRVPTSGKEITACHSLMFPYRVFYCHNFNTVFTKLYNVSLVVDSGPLSLMALCHRDTSDWAAGHRAFVELKSAPGKTDACHFMSQSGLVWY